MKTTTSFVLALASVLACSRDLPLPSPPTPVGKPTIAGFSPPEAYTGTVLHVTGTGFGSVADSIVVRFSASASVHPRAVAEDGSWLDVRVPDGSQSGPIRITTPGGEAESKRFEYLGPGHLRRGGVSTRMSLRPHVEAIALDEPGHVGLFAPGYGWVAQVDSSLDFRFRDTTFAAAIAPLAGSPDFLLLAQFDDLTPPCAGTTLARFVDGRPVVRACLPHRTSEDPPEAMAVDASGELVVATTWSGAWFVDLGESPPKVRRFPAPARASWRSPAWVSAERFVVAEDAALRTLEFATGPGVRVALDAPPEADRASVAVRGTTLVASVGGRFEWFDATTWPPVHRQSLDLLGIFGPIALSRDGEHAAVSDLPTGTLMAFVDLHEEPARLVGTAALAVPGVPSGGPDSSFYVGVNTGWEVLSQEGRSLGTWSVPYGLAPPHLVLDETGGTGAPLVLLLSRTFASAQVYDANTLQQWGAVPAGRVENLASTASSPDVYAEWDGNVERVADAEHGYYALPAGSFTGPRRIDLADDGSVLLLRSSDDDGVQTVRVLDTTRPWTPSLPVGTASVGEPLLASWFDAQSRRLVLVSAHHVRAFDCANPASCTPVGEGEHTDAPHLAAGISRAYVVTLAEGSEAQPVLRLYSVTDGRLLSEQPLPFGVERVTDVQQDVDAIVVAPGGLRAWWLAPFGSGRQIASVAIDPDTFTPSALAPMPVPVGSSELFGYPDGEALLVVDRQTDTILLVQ